MGNICNFAYNVPFVWVVVKHRNANNISGKFLYLRVFTSIVWILYSIFTQEIFVGCSYTVTLISSCIVLYIKLTQKEIKEIKEKQGNPIKKEIKRKEVKKCVVVDGGK